MRAAVRLQRGCRISAVLLRNDLVRCIDSFVRCCLPWTCCICARYIDSLFPVGALFVAVELWGGEFVFIEYCCYFCLLLGRNELVSLLGVIESALAAKLAARFAFRYLCYVGGRYAIVRCGGSGCNWYSRATWRRRQCAAFAHSLYVA